MEEWNRQCLEVAIYNRMQQLYSRYRSTHPREVGAELAEQYGALLEALPEEQAAVVRGLLDGMAIAATVQDIREKWGGALWDTLY